MKYKYNIGDRVIRPHKVYFMKTEWFPEYVNKLMIVTGRTTGQLGNQYELYCPKDDSTCAWFFEEPLELFKE